MHDDPGHCGPAPLAVSHAHVLPVLRSGFITPSDTRGRRCRPLELLTYCRICCAFESACALPAGVIRGCETTSRNMLAGPPVSPKTWEDAEDAMDVLRESVTN